ncbi:hypothetical protein [Actinokineospora sp. UTMC 2448]|nr:hypothetical protein [Actinokineospora sp. UTMC 2448]UVS78432.1 hypothetical protein Actkin_02165 [Actinokineospora sp. UTMC 2448]
MLAVLGAHRDTSIVKQHVVDELVWFDRVESDGSGCLLRVRQPFWR